MEKKNQRHQSIPYEDLSEGHKNEVRGSNHAPAFPDLPNSKPAGRRIGEKKRLDVQGVRDEIDGYCETITIIEDRKMKQADTSKIIQSLNNHLFFSNLSEEEIETVISKMFYASVEAECHVFMQKDNASCFFILSEGSVTVSIDGQEKKKLGPGDTFGELALLYDAPRSASIRCSEKSYFWAIDRVAFKKIIEEVTKKQFSENRKFLSSVELFANMSDSQKDSITSSMLSQIYQDGQNLVSKGDQADSYFIIKEGTVECVEESGKVVREIGKGETFGEAALYEDVTRSLSVRAKGKVKCIAIARNTLKGILGNIAKVVDNNWQRWALNEDKVFGRLTKLQVEKWILNAPVSEVKAGDTLCKQGDPFRDVIVFISGTATDKNTKKEYGKKMVFGAEYVYGKEMDGKKLESTIVMKTDGKISMLNKGKLVEFLGGALDTVLKKNENSHEKKMGQLDTVFRKTVEGMKLQDLIHIKKLGEGQFGEVFLCYSRKTNTYYALKCISREKIAKFNLERHTIQEKSVLEMINFPLIIKLYRTFQDKSCIYFLLSYCQGMELFDAIRQMDFLESPQAAFYISSMILSIEYLHSFRVVYRDIKPENIMVNEKGQLRLIDMGTAKVLGTKGEIARTYTILGTPHYMAPEILLGKGYGLKVDLWSIGVCLFEFMCGMVPFGDECEEPYDVYQQVISQKLSFPSYFYVPKNKNAAKMMTQLMNRSADGRDRGSYGALKAHPWFDTVDWDSVAENKLQGPFVPTAEHLIDRSTAEKAIKAQVSITEILAKTIKVDRKRIDARKPTVANWDAAF